MILLLWKCCEGVNFMNAVYSQPKAHAAVGPSGVGTIPNCPETETLVLLQGFIAPILRGASSWTALTEQLAKKGYALVLRDGQGILLSKDADKDVCTCAHLGMALSDLTKRLGPPPQSV